MINAKKDYRILFLLYSALAVLVFHGCYSVEEKKEPQELSKGQITLFLNGPEETSADITFDLSAADMVNEDGVRINVLDDGPARINSTAVEGRQVLLSERTIPEGRYKWLRLGFSSALLRKEGRAASLALPDEDIQIPLDVVVSREQNISLFMNWNADASVADGYLFRPAITVRSQIPELSALLVYVTNEDSDNVSVINRRSGAVVATIMVGRKPRGIAAFSKGGRSRVYVANSGSGTVSVIDPTTNKIENEISLRFGRRPEGIAVASISSGKELVFVTNYDTNSVSVIDSATFHETEKIDVGQGPVAVAVDPPVDDLPGSRYLGSEDINLLRSYRERFFNVYVVNRNSNSVSVIRVDNATGRSVGVVELPVEWKPVALSVDYIRGKVYVVNYGSDKLSVLDIVKVSKGLGSLAVSAINNVGNYISGVVSDPAFDRVYLLKEAPGELMFIRPFSDSIDPLKSVLPPVMGAVPVGDSPGAIVLGPDNRKLYVVNRGSNTVSVVDKTTRKEEQVIQVGRRPYGIAIFQD